MTMNAAQLVTASFTLDQHDLNVAIDGNGSVSSDPLGIACGVDCAEMFDYGTVVTLTANADANHLFTGWSGACTGNGDCVVTMSSAKNVTASFAVNEYDLNVTVDGDGTVSSDPSGISCGADYTETFEHGTVVTLTATPEPNYLFAGWSGGCSGSEVCVVALGGQ